MGLALISGVERRRLWSAADKLRIAGEAGLIAGRRARPHR